MKTKLFSAVLSLLLSGCTSHFPKDAYGQNVKSTINTPWGSREWSAEKLATGTAAIEAAKDIPVDANKTSNE